MATKERQVCRFLEMAFNITAQFENPGCFLAFVKTINILVFVVVGGLVY